MLSNTYSETTISNRKHAFQYEMVPIELTNKVEIDFGDGYCLTKIENIIKSPIYNIRNSKLLKYIENDMPELLVASEQVSISGMNLMQLIELVEEEKNHYKNYDRFFQKGITYNNNCVL